LPDGVPFIIPLELPLCIIPSGIADPGAVSGKKHGFCFTETSKESGHVKMADKGASKRSTYQQVKEEWKLESGNKIS